MHLTLHMTRDCNMACSYCYQSRVRGEDMDAETAYRALELGTRTTKGSCGIIFFGGEPLLRRELIEATVARARRMEGEGEGPFHFKLTTNGLLLDEDFLEYSLANDILIALSFDGVREAHDSHRRRGSGGASHDEVLAKLRLLLAARPYASILMTVNPDSAAHLAESVTLLVEEGCRYIVVSLNHGAEWSNRDLCRLRRQYDRLGELYLRWTREGRKFYLSPLEMKLASHIKGEAYREDRCELGQRQISVGPDGSLFPCVQFAGDGPGSEWCIGHVRTGIDEAAREHLRLRSTEEKEPCRDCAVRARCHHTCGCLNRQATGSVNRVSGVLCHSEQMLMAVADRVGERLYRERNALFLNKHYNAAYPVLSLIEDSRV